MGLHETLGAGLHLLIQALVQRLEKRLMFLGEAQGTRPLVPEPQPPSQGYQQARHREKTVPQGPSRYPH